jgi:hypothetical protein
MLSCARLGSGEDNKRIFTTGSFQKLREKPSKEGVSKAPFIRKNCIDQLETPLNVAVGRISNPSNLAQQTHNAIGAIPHSLQNKNSPPSKTTPPLLPTYYNKTTTPIATNPKSAALEAHEFHPTPRVSPLVCSGISPVGVPFTCVPFVSVASICGFIVVVEEGRGDWDERPCVPAIHPGGNMVPINCLLTTAWKLAVSGGI